MEARALGVESGSIGLLLRRKRNRSEVGISGRGGLTSGPPQMVDDSPSRDRAEPAAERVAGAVATKPIERVLHACEHLLADVGNVGAAEPGTAAPVMDERSVKVDEPVPGHCVIAAGPLEECERGRGEPVTGVGAYHRRIPASRTRPPDARDGQSDGAGRLGN